MPDEKRDVTKFTKYFGMKLPSENVLILILLLFGIISGILAEFILSTGLSLVYLLIYGSSIGVTVITFPAILTALLLKVIKRNFKLKHALIVVIVITFTYAAFFLISIFTYKLTGSYAIAYLPMLLSDAGIYGYWFIINRIILNQRKGQIITAAIQPLLNALIFIPVSYSLFAVNISYDYVLIKLWIGMFAFMLCGYSILYIMDRPSKKQFNFSGVELMTVMINQWLYNIKKDNNALSGMGIKRELPISILALKGKTQIKAVFVKPEIHYGPINGIGGSITTEHLGKKIVKQYNAAPFILHGAVNLEDNPVSSSQISEIWRVVEKAIPSKNLNSFKHCAASFSSFSTNGCKAIGIRIDNLSLLSLTKAPLVTEDIDNDIGSSFESISKKYGLESILIDAHNSRFESAEKDELKGIYKGSKYVNMYSNSINKVLESLTSKAQDKLLFGSSCLLLKNQIHKNDIGPGYMSIGIFKIKNTNFCMVYFDSNNIMPSLRTELISHINKKYGFDAEIYTTDTHAVNTLALSASNVLGRFTTINELIPFLDNSIDAAKKDMEQVTYYYSKIKLKNFRVWGKGSEDAIMKVSRDVIKTGKKTVPFIIVGFFIIAAWAIYLV